MERKESDQLPEEGAEEYTPDDVPGDERDEAKDSPGGAGDADSDPETATGNPPDAD